MAAPSGAREAGKAPEKRRAARRPRAPEPVAAYDDAAPQVAPAPTRAKIPVTGAPTDVPAPFAHNAEYEFARILDFYGIAWEYEPRSFPLRWERGHVTEAFTPDFYLPDLNLFVELTTLKAGLTAEKNRKMRQLKELYPDTNIILLKKRDYLRLLAKYGYGAIPPSQALEIDRVLIPATKVNQRVQELGAQISKDYAGTEPVLVGVLRGVLVFIADLMRHISVPTSVDLMSVSTYDGNGAAAVRILKDLDINIKAKHVILVEDIVDTGMTLNHILEYLQTKRPASVKVCTLLDKRVRRLVDVPLEYVGFEIPDEFVVGYGLDFHQRFRNLPFVGTLKHELLP
jgi:hypoxanthine phosphoribosyltransferase